MRYRSSYWTCSVLVIRSLGMMMKLIGLLVLSLAALARCQRPSFAGSRPIGYPEVTTEGSLADRFGEVDGTTQRLPVEANGDRDLVDRLSKLPIDKQPFWFINWQALEAHRQNPQTYPQKPNPFIDPPTGSPTGSSTGNFGVSNSRNPSSGNVGTSSSGTPNSGSFGAPNSGNLGTANAGNAGSLDNRNAGNLNSGNAFTVPISSSNAPNVANRNSVTANPTSTSSVSSGLGDRFGGIELNQFPGTENLNTNSGSNSNFKPSNTVSANYPVYLR